jgi:hypothetical protein
MQVVEFLNKFAFVIVSLRQSHLVLNCVLLGCPIDNASRIALTVQDIFAKQTEY